MKENKKPEKITLGTALVEVAGVLIFMAVLLFVVSPASLLVLGFGYAKHQSEKLSKEVHKIEGVIANIEIIPEEDKSQPLTKQEESTQPQRANVIVIGHDPLAGPKTKITFKDGRFMELRGLSSRPLEAGKYYIITYNGLKQITDTEEQKP